MKPEISIIIVNYNSKELLLNCLRSILFSIDCNFEVIVVDNNSSDFSLHHAQKEIRDSRFVFLKLESNLGFSKANNIGFHHSNGSIIHFLNPDTEVNNSINNDYREAIKFPLKVYVNPLINRDNSIENSKSTLPLLDNYAKKICCFGNVKYWYIGASVIISRINFQKIGLWNESYFLYSEDMDLFYKIKKNGMEIIELKSKILHLGGGCSQSVWNSLECEVMKEKSSFLFFKMNRTIFEYLCVKVIIILGLFLKSPSHGFWKLKVWFAFLKSKHS